MKTTNKLAFTMIELIFVIVALGIIVSLAVPRLERDHLQDAAVQILQDIRYTQHLALMDDKTDPNNAQWQRRFWKISFASCSANSTWYYGIGSDVNGDSGGFFEETEAAIDPLNGLRMFGTSASCNTAGAVGLSPRVFITKKFGITKVEFSATNIGAGVTVTLDTSRYIGFDYMGRPHRAYGNSLAPNYASVLQQDLNITFTMSDNQKFSIIIEEQTGHAHIDGQPDS